MKKYIHICIYIYIYVEGLGFRVSREEGNVSYRDYIRSLFPFSLVSYRGLGARL